MKEEWVQQDIKITVTSNHAAEYHLKKTIPKRSKARLALFSLTPKRLHEPIRSSLSRSDRKSMSGFLQSLSITGLKIQVASTPVAIPSSHGERYRAHGDHDIIPRGCSIYIFDMLPRDQPRCPSPCRRSSPVIVMGTYEMSGLVVVVKQQLNSHRPHTNHRDPREGPK